MSCESPVLLISVGRATDDPSNDQQARGDPFRTLFVARLSYDVKESDLEREFGRFGPIERVWLPASPERALIGVAKLTIIRFVSSRTP